MATNRSDEDRAGSYVDGGVPFYTADKPLAKPLDRPTMKITICDLNPAVLGAWPASWSTIPGADISLRMASIVDIECDAVVSPANSFGFMDGGVDYVYSKHFGWHVQERVQRLIAQRGFGELLVGQAIMVRTDNKRIPFLISAPTMRVPKRIADPADIMLATRAAVHLAAASDHLSHIAFPGMGTGCGEVPVDLAARAMLAGIKAGLARVVAPPATWQEAQRRHFNLEP